MKKYFAAVVVALFAGLTLAATASADVARYQPTATLVVSLTDAQPGNQHTFTITWTNPCGPSGAFTGNGQGNTAAGGATETISGSLIGGQLKFTAIYTSFIPGYTWTYNGPLAGAALGGDATGYHATATVTAISTYKNHGDYVKQTGGADAAHSCIGIPIQNVAMTFTATVPEGAANQWTNVWTHTYLINYDAVTHAFSGTGSVSGTLGGFSNTETITGTYDGPSINFDARYVTGPYSLSGTPSFDYHWLYSGAFDVVGWATSNLPGQPPLEVIVTEPVAVP